MIGLRVEGIYHWGYWVRIPGTSKLQPSIPLPPPTTLMGALALPLVRNGLVKYDGKAAGESIMQSNKQARGKKLGFESSVSLLEQTVCACSASLQGAAMYWEDINKYNTLLFQQFTRSTAEEREVGGRRYLPRYLTGAITTGKVYYPSGGLIVLYLLDERVLGSMLTPPWKPKLEEACWTITRIGSKESLFSVRKVDLSRPRETKGEVKTKFYFPSRAGEVREDQNFYRESFWRGGWGRYDPPVFVEYVIPGQRTPIRSEPIVVKAVDKAYEFGPEEILLVAG